MANDEKRALSALELLERQCASIHEAVAEMERTLAQLRAGARPAPNSGGGPGEEQ